MKNKAAQELARARWKRTKKKDRKMWSKDMHEAKAKKKESSLSPNSASQ